ncbi:deoxyribonuclease gamma-like isoform X3 [Hoplias malabaricus]|uniref:deoxyribonuclease gamma-like isoform X3 n=1 Tax=Hoplias malabaricus TaxID=27720 RepID=UPI003461A1EC
MKLSLFLLLNLGGVFSLKICSFNIQSFGETKLQKPAVLSVIVECLARCDLTLVMEIKDTKGEAFPQLMTRLNRYRGRRLEYGYVISERLGRKSYKEQYAFIYRQRSVSVKSVYQYPDAQTDDVDAFAREPFIVWFSSPTTEIKEFVIIPIHTTPEAAVKEIDELYDVYQNVSQRWPSQQNFILMGDFNAACGYVPKKEWPNIRLRSDTEFLWLTNDKLDTSVKQSTSCAYDRVVLRGEKMIQAVPADSVEVFDFKQVFGLTEQEALAVSDHFPLCFTVSGGRRSG